ncbi:MAG: cell division protein FtsZ [Candidatus Colwellbacteria bacterium]|nr:cell division protein FtsZ [Candidatus Colwellbacteria bacterium]
MSPGRRGKSFVKIKVVGIGGGGGNVITRMRKDFTQRGVEFIAINTDVQDLEACDAHQKLHIGRALTRGLGAGMNPEIGQQAAEENRSEILEALQGADMLFLTAGFGGGTGTGALPVVADIGREAGALTVAVVTKPFAFEGSARMRIAEDGVLRIKDRVDTFLVIPNDRIFSIIDQDTPVLKAFEKIDEILKSSVRGVAEIIAAAGLINVDFADVEAIMRDAGMAVVGVGVSSGADRAVKAVTQAVSSPLLDISIEGAKSVLFGIAGGRDLKMTEINEAARSITENVDPGAKIIFGAYNDRKIKPGQIKIILIATGFNGMALKRDSLPSLFIERAETSPLVQEEFEEVGPRLGFNEAKSSSKAEEEKGSESEPAEDTWDAPAFLRKKRRR